MTAEIDESPLFTVRCTECAEPEFSTTSRINAERYADQHDATFHPTIEDEDA